MKKNSSRIESVRIIEVIEVTYTDGDGSYDNPHTRKAEYYSLNGNLLSEADPKPWYGDER